MNGERRGQETAPGAVIPPRPATAPPPPPVSSGAGVPVAAITAYGGCRDMTCGCISARAYRAGRAAERDRIRQLATERKAWCLTDPDDALHSNWQMFADLLGGPS